MDPNANLTEALELARILFPDREEDTVTDADVLISNGARLAELLLALDGWLVKGGFAPERWNTGRRKAAEDLIASIEVDDTAGVDANEQSCMVLGNVGVETLETLGFDIPQE